MLPRPRHLAAGTAGLLLMAGLATPAAAAPAPAARPLGLAAAGGSGYTGFSNGTLVFANALNLPPVDVARVGLGQSAAGVQLPGPLGSAAVNDQLKQPLLVAAKAGKTAYGHASGANVGLLSAQTAQPQLAETLVEATSPAPSSASGDLLTLPASPLATAQVLPSSAAANTTAAGSCVIGKDISNGDASVANATVLAATPATPVVKLGQTSQTVSRERLVQQTDGTGKVVGTVRSGLLSQSTQTLAPITLLAGTPAELTITVLGPIQLSVAAGGLPGTSVVSYGMPGKSGTEPVVTVSAGGSTQMLTADQVFGGRGFVIPLGIADITIGTPAHALTGNETTQPHRAADGTSAAAAADFVRVSVPGTLPTPGVDPLDGPLAPLNAVLNPILAGADPLLSALQAALADAGLNAADVRIGHLEASATVPVGGIDCGTLDNPLDESRKDVSATHVTPGQTFDYTIRIPNRGTAPISNVTVDDTYSAGLEFVSSVPAPTSRSGNKLHYELGTLAPNEFRTIVMTFRAPAAAADGTVYHNDAVIKGTYQGQPITQDVDVDGPTVISTLPGGCDLSGSTKYASNTQVTTGESFGYFVNVFNSGGQECRDVVVTDTLDKGVAFVSCTDGCTRSGQDLTWKVGTVAPGQSLVLGVIVKVTATSGTLPNAADVTPAAGKPGNPSTPGPTVTTVSVPAEGVPAELAGSSGPLPHTGPDTLPRTGPPAGPAAAGLLLMVTAGLLVRRHRLAAAL